MLAGVMFLSYIPDKFRPTQPTSTQPTIESITESELDDYIAIENNKLKLRGGSRIFPVHYDDAVLREFQVYKERRIEFMLVTSEYKGRWINANGQRPQGLYLNVIEHFPYNDPEILTQVDAVKLHAVDLSQEPAEIIKRDFNSDQIDPATKIMIKDLSRLYKAVKVR
tara:strand:+ start:6858 stop:7358 length:501 start_codon:yes stop_codon:yes gene_type:complete